MIGFLGLPITGIPLQTGGRTTTDSNQMRNKESRYDLAYQLQIKLGKFELEVPFLDQWVQLLITTTKPPSRIPYFQFHSLMRLLIPIGQIWVFHSQDLTSDPPSMPSWVSPTPWLRYVFPARSLYVEFTSPYTISDSYSDYTFSRPATDYLHSRLSTTLLH